VRLLVIHSGEYSDQQWTPLFVPDDFDLAAARRGYREHVVEHEEEDGYVGLECMSYVGYLCKHHGARDPEPSEIIEEDDPVHYGRWDADSSWGPEYSRAAAGFEATAAAFTAAMNAFDLDDPLQRLVTDRVNSAKGFPNEETARRVAKALRVNGRVGYPSSDLIDLFGLIPEEPDSLVYTLPERVRIDA
jgi:hypothetical protein